MNPLLTTGLRFRSLFKKVDGSSFYGQVLDLPDTSRVSNFLSARRYLRTQPTTNVKLRDVVVINGSKFIVAEHGDGFYRDHIYKHFKLFHVDEVLEHYEMRTETNMITGLEQMKRNVYTDDVYLSTQPDSSISDRIGIPGITKIAVCNKPVKVDDLIGPYVVIKSDIVLGVNLVELKQT